MADTELLVGHLQIAGHLLLLLVLAAAAFRLAEQAMIEVVELLDELRVCARSTAKLEALPASKTFLFGFLAANCLACKVASQQLHFGLVRIWLVARQLQLGRHCFARLLR